MERAPRNRSLEIALLVLILLGCVFLLTQMSGLLLGIWVVLRAVLAPFLISVIISYLLNPIVNKLVSRGVPRGVSVIIIYFVFFTLVTVVLVNSIPIFVTQLKEFVETLPSIIEQVEKWSKNLDDGARAMPEAIHRAIDTNLIALEEALTRYITNLLGSLGSTLEWLFTVLVIPFLVFYMLKDLKVFERTVVALFPTRHRKELIELIKSIDEALGSYVRGQLLVMLAVGVLTYVGYLIVGMPYSLMLALVVAITNIIPYIGPFIGAAPAIILAFTVSPLMALKVTIVNLVVQQLEGNVISPQIVSRTLDLHPLLIIFALLLGGEVGGVVGLILAVPFVAILKVVLEHLVEHYVRR
ncbi:AI-2E family transporter [Effusibacillus lacus]|uniref:AI-2E family transporter n=1 Tax=Effusibacillus lacus TaxID=1348429 RepID=A0A292YMB1_9BACL|nr:AI-2E family transporter [Effusibacillus lacus]TCS72024.1 putative PurR-regulated permease PerM [Effusibacillus lacus]GAX90316.1 AI-2E family transporter [Effusibacillus lacus]